MTKHLYSPTDAVLVAIDMSKHRQEVLMERPEGGRRRRMTVMATKNDYDRLVDELAAIGRPIVVGFEATGNYHRTLAHRLLMAGFRQTLVSRFGSSPEFSACSEANFRTQATLETYNC